MLGYRMEEKGEERTEETYRNTESNFCGRKGHNKKDCKERETWLQKVKERKIKTGEWLKDKEWTKKKDSEEAQKKKGKGEEKVTLIAYRRKL